MGAGRILVVDDERFFQELFRELLQAAGHQVRVSASGADALKLMAEEHFDVLLTDIVMPGLDGVALVREAKKRDPDLEAVAITGHDDVRLAVQAMKAGCADFLTKPVDRDELVQVCERALARVRLRREHSQLLNENLEFVKSQALYRQGLQIMATLDGERLQDLALSVLARVTDAQGAALWIADEKGQLQLRSYRGLVDRAALPPRIDPKDPEWAPRFAQSAPSTAAGAKDATEAFHVPLFADEEPVGLALLSDRARGGFAPEHHAAALTVADFTAIALKNARRFQALERIGLRDRETRAYNLAYFIDYAGKEFYKARRYGRGFSLVVLSIDNTEQMRKEGGRELYRRATRDLERRCPVLLSMGASTFPKDGEDFDELLHWARARVEEQRGSLLRRLHLSDVPANAFWELSDLLLSHHARIPESSPSARLPRDAELFAAAQREAAREIGRDPRARGVLYVGTRERFGLAPVVQALPPGDVAARAGDTTVRVYLLGPRSADAAPIGHPLVTEVYVDGDPRFAGHEFLLFISEHSAYGLIAGPGGRTFHTSDVPLVDALVSKLQTLYDLQPL